MHSCTADTQPTAYVGMQKESSPEPNTASASHPNPAYAPRLCSACRGKLRASKKREDLSSTLVHSLWPVRRCLKALTLPCLIQIQILMHVCVRNSPQKHCVLPSTSIPVFSPRPREHSSSLYHCTSTESSSSSHKNCPNQVGCSRKQCYAASRNQDKHKCTSVANTQHPVGRHTTVQAIMMYKQQTKASSPHKIPKRPPKRPIPAPTTQIKRSTRRRRQG